MATVDAAVRDVTPSEVDHFADKGWAFLPGLITPDAARTLLDGAKRLMGDRADTHENATASGRNWFATHHQTHLHDDHYREIVMHEQFGRDAAELLGRDMSIRLLTSSILVKVPASSSEAGSAATEYHQDDRHRPALSTSITFWLALDEVTPPMGSMRFYEGSHKLGWLVPPPLAAWPRLNQCPLSDPIHYMPGDATAHSGLVVHGAPENALADRLRWGCQIAYMPADAPFTGMPYVWTDDLHASGQISAGKPLDHARFPVVYAAD